MTFQCPTNQKLTDKPAFLDDAKLQAPPRAGGVPVWTPGDPAVATLTPAADGFSAEIVPIASGVYSYSFTDGNLTYAETIDFTVPVATSVVPGLTAQPLA